ncbi:hypothetical protein WT59_22140 [Burkholderia territorii]|nr:hypothetical protein WT59_22140 [Burkholderia territorii]
MAERYADLKAKIQTVYDHHKGRYGYRRITAAIRQTGDAINHKTVQRLMGHAARDLDAQRTQHTFWKQFGRCGWGHLNNQ